MARGRAGAVVAGLAGVVATALAGAPASGADDGQVAAAIAAALPADGRTDVVVIDLPAVAGAPRVRAATRVNAAPATVRAVLLDPSHYQALIPSLIRSDVHQDATGTPIVDWELEVPLFNLSGRFALRARPDGVELDLYDGDFAPGHLLFWIAPGPGGASVLSVDASMDVRRSSWLLRRILNRSPFGPPAALSAAIDVALRGVALRAEHPGARDAWRPTAPPGPPAAWQPDARPLASPAFAPLRTAGVVAMVARRPDERLAGVTAAITVDAPAASVDATLRDPRSWRTFPGWKTVQLVPGAAGPGGRVEDDLPLLDLDATYAAVGPARWTAVEGATRGARLGWTVAPDGDRRATAALSIYPRLETTGSIARRFLAAEPLLESGLALATGFANVASTKAALARTR
jgi:hypothetical protein